MSDRRVKFRCTSCGARQEIIMSGGARRSGQEHRTFFGMIDAAFDNWPERHKFQPQTCEHLRAWLLIEVGHCNELHYPDVRVKDIPALADLMVFLTGHKHFRVKPSGSNSVCFFAPRSMSFQTVADRDEFQRVAQLVYDVIYLVCRISVSEYIQNSLPATEHANKKRCGHND